MQASEDNRNYILLAFVVLLSAVSLALLLRTQGFVFLPDNPARQVVEISISFWSRGSLSRPDLDAFLIEMLSRSREVVDGYFWQDRISISADGNVYPKHAVLLSILFSPIFGMFGKLGVWIVNQLMLLALICGEYKLCRSISSPRAALYSTLLFAFGTRILFSSYGFSYDLFSAACIVWGFALAPAAPVRGGAFVALATIIRPTNLAFVAGVVFFSWFHQGSGRRAIKTLLAALTGVSIIALTNYWLWESPLKGAYARLPVFSAGGYFFDQTTHVFSFALFLNKFFSRLAIGPDSVVFQYPAVVLIGTGIIAGLFKRVRFSRVVIGLMVVGIATAVIALGFPAWDGVGSWRFVLPSVALLWPVVGMNYLPFRAR